jgi:predicted ribosome quality control (RQC) complex YloA/Tae2 family protein
MVHELKSRLVGMRLANMYDINPRTYLFKFAKTEQKSILLVESGNRMHITEFFRDKNANPSGFTMKLRKHLRTRRLNHVRQLGIDRVVDFEFGAGETAYHVIVEFYAGGNIILTNYSYTILALLRVVEPEESIKIAVGQLYPIEQCRHIEPMTADRLLGILKTSKAKETLKQVLSSHADYGAALVENAILEAGLHGGSKLASEFDCHLDSTQFKLLFEALQRADHLMELSAREIQKVRALFVLNLMLNCYSELSRDIYFWINEPHLVRVEDTKSSIL